MKEVKVKDVASKIQDMKEENELNISGSTYPINKVNMAAQSNL